MKAGREKDLRVLRWVHPEWTRRPVRSLQGGSSPDRAIRPPGRECPPGSNARTSSALNSPFLISSAAPSPSPTHDGEVLGKMILDLSLNRCGVRGRVYDGISPLPSDAQIHHPLRLEYL